MNHNEFIEHPNPQSFSKEISLLRVGGISWLGREVAVIAILNPKKDKFESHIFKSLILILMKI